MPATTCTTINGKDDTQYGSVANGGDVGSGYDVDIKRLSPCEAIVNVTTPNMSKDWLLQIEVEPDTDLQALAVEIGNNPFSGEDDYASIGEDPYDQWDELAAKWNSVKLER